MGDNTRMAEKFAAYCSLRDAGSLPVDAAREVGIPADFSGTLGRYEKAYRTARCIPPKLRRALSSRLGSLNGPA